MKKLELLSPAGSLEICKAVIDAGADAVYLGGNMFGARAYAKNFDQEQLFEALDYAHLFDKKIFLTVNTLLKNQEIEKYLYDYIEPLYRHGLDAAIVQDFGVLQFLHRHFPDLPLHASTQMSVTNPYGGAWLKEQGVSRVVIAREISLEEISDLYRQTHLEIESFVHGALCYCYSGQCLLSSLLGGRSGNRGRCAQPCRLQYDVVDGNNRRYNKGQQYPLSPKDLCTIDFLPAMAEAGVFSYKIEGRMKQMEYAAGVTSLYRKYIDLYLSGPKEYKVSKKDKERLLNLGNRNGFTEGYYYSRNDKSMLSLTTSAHKSGEEKTVSPGKKSQIPVRMTAELMTGKPASLILEDETYRVMVQGEVVMQALKQPLRREDVAERLSKTGDTEFAPDQIQVSLSEDAFLPVKFMNELRRNGLEELRRKHLERYERKLPDEARISGTEVLQKSKVSITAGAVSTGSLLETGRNGMNTKKNGVSVLVRTEAQLSAVIKTDFVDTIYIDSSLGNQINKLKTLSIQIQDSGKRAILALPHVFRKNSADFLLNQKETIRDCSLDGLLVRTYDGIGFCQKEFPEQHLTADHGLYTYSDWAINGFAENGIEKMTVPFELNERELRSRCNQNSEMIVYGWIPVMHTAQCIYKNFETCHRGKGADHILYLKDRYGKNFPVLCDCVNCCNTIYNTQPLYLFGQQQKLDHMDFCSYRLEFLLESEKETRSILREFRETFLEGKKADMTRWENCFTNGHFKRGVE